MTASDPFILVHIADNQPLFPTHPAGIAKGVVISVPSKANVADTAGSIIISSLSVFKKLAVFVLNARVRTLPARDPQSHALAGS